MNARYRNLLGLMFACLVCTSARGVDVTLIAVGASGPFTILGNEIIVPSGGTRITVDVFISDWDNDLNGDPLLRTYQVQFSSASFLTGSAGSIALANIPCTTDADCRGDIICGLQVPGFCDVQFGAHAAAYIDDTRTGFVFFGKNTITAVDTSQPDFRFAGLVLNLADAIADTGFLKYAATVIIETSADAQGTFTLSMIQSPTETFFLDSTDQPIEPVVLRTLRITIVNDCNLNGVDDGDDIASGFSNDCDGNGTPDECQTDCNQNGFVDSCDITSGTSEDCDNNGVPDECQGGDCNSNGLLDVCELAAGMGEDCDSNGVPDDCQDDDCNFNNMIDSCELAAGVGTDCDGNGVPDDCQNEDCNQNGIFDACDIASGTALDANGNGIPDECEQARIFLSATGSIGPHFIMGNDITVPVGGTRLTLDIFVSNWDFDGDGVPKLRAYQAQFNSLTFTSGNTGFLHLADIPCATDNDCLGDIICGTQISGICDTGFGSHAAAFIDESRSDYLFFGLNTILAVDTSRVDFRYGGVTDLVSDAIFDLGFPKYIGTAILQTSPDAEGTFTIELIPAAGTFIAQADGQLIEPLLLSSVQIHVVHDCNLNGIDDADEIASGSSADCDLNGIPDECQEDCNLNGIADVCDLAAGTSADCDSNGVPDECQNEDCNQNGVLDNCEVASGATPDCDGNGVPDECQTEDDCNQNGLIDSCEVMAGLATDCDNNNVPDECQDEDCNENGLLDFCEIRDGTTLDENGNGFPDECELAHLILRPVSARSGHFFIGDEISIPPGGSTLTLDIFVKSWDFSLIGSPRLRAAQAQIDSIGFTSASSGSLKLAELPCTSDDDCFGNSTCGQLVTGLCDSTIQNHAAAFIDTDRPDFLLYNLNSFIAVDTSQPDMRYGMLVVNPAEAVADDGQERYIGTLILDVSSDATGTFTIGFLPLESLLFDEADQDIPIAFDRSKPARIMINEDCNNNGIPDVDEIAGGSGFDCNSNGFLDSCDIAHNLAIDCDGGGIPDECEPFVDCNGNGLLDACDILSGVSEDADGSLVPDECEFIEPVILAAGCRFFTISPPQGTQPVAILVTSSATSCVDGFVSDTTRAIGFTSAVTYLMPADWGEVMVTGPQILPNTTYEIRTVSEQGALSRPAMVTTALWGDVARVLAGGGWGLPDGVVQMVDAVAVIDGFRQDPMAPAMEWIDLYPSNPDGSIDLIDAVMVIDAFRGLPYDLGNPCSPQ